MTATKARKKSAQAAPKAQAAQGMSSIDKMVETDKINKGLYPSPSGNGSKPAPLPGEKGFDWQAQYPDETIFVYTVPADGTDNYGNPIGGQTVALAGISEKRQPDVGFLLDVRDKQEFDQVVDMIKLVAAPAAITVIRPWRPTDLQPLFEAWNEWQRTTAGKR